jgi:chromosome segregation ATPase
MRAEPARASVPAIAASEWQGAGATRASAPAAVSLEEDGDQRLLKKSQTLRQSLQERFTAWQQNKQTRMLEATQLQQRLATWLRDWDQDQGNFPDAQQEVMNAITQMTQKSEDLEREVAQIDVQIEGALHQSIEALDAQMQELRTARTQRKRRATTSSTSDSVTQSMADEIEALSTQKIALMQQAQEISRRGSR